MLFTAAQLFEIKEIIKDYHDAFIINAVGDKALPEEIVKRLKEKGLINPQVNSIQDAYLYGQILSMLETKQVADMSYSQFKAYVKKNPIPLTVAEKQAIQMATLHAGQFCQGLGNKVGATVGSDLIEADSKLRARLETDIRTVTAENIVKRETVKQLKSDLGWKTKDWARDWDRIAVTEKQTAMQEGVADGIRKDHGGEAWVSKIPQPGACQHCFKAGTLIHTRRGKIPIENIIVGDEVLTHKMRWRHVTELYKRWYSGDLYGLDGSPFATGNHPFLIDGQWQRADTLQAGQNVVQLRDVGNADKQPALASDNSFFLGIPITGGRGIMPVTSVQFYRHLQRRDSKINVVDVDGVFQDGLVSLSKQQGFKGQGILRSQFFITLMRLRNFLSNFRIALYSQSLPRFSRICSFRFSRDGLFRIKAFFSNATCFLRSITISNWNAQVFKGLNNVAFAYTVPGGQILDTEQFLFVQSTKFFQWDRFCEKSGSLPMVADRNSPFDEDLFYSGNRDSMFFMERSNPNPLLIFEDNTFLVDSCGRHSVGYRKLGHICKQVFNGNVYNFGVEEDESYIANDFVVHNCTRLHVGPDGHPRIFKLATLEANGTNFGKKKPDWQAVVGTVHPNCQCTLVRVPKGWGYDEEGDLVPGGKGGKHYEDEKAVTKALRAEQNLQKAIQNNRKIAFQGFLITIEQPVGSTRTWRTPEGETGETRFKIAYGFINRTEGMDGDEIDVFIGPDPSAENVYVIEQQNRNTGTYDEQKCMLGFSNGREAELAYRNHYDNPDEFILSIQEMDLDHFRRWIANTGPRKGEMGKSGVRLVLPVEDRLLKAGKVGGRYIRRVPYTDKNGKRRYRYFYAESAIARDVKAGETIRLGGDLIQVEKVDPNGTVHLRSRDQTLAVKGHQWATFVSEFYGQAYYKWAEKRAMQSVNAVLQHVPKEMLGELKGATDKARLADLKKRVPDVYEKLQKSFARAGVNPFRAKQVIGASLERKGWEPEARAAVIGDVITKRNQDYRTTIRAAENLAGGKIVKLGHVAAVTEISREIRAPEPEPEKKPVRKPVKGKKRAKEKPKEAAKETAKKDPIAEVATKAEKEIAKLSALLEQARGSGTAEDAAQTLATALSSTAIQKLLLIAKAFPGLADKAVEPAKEIMLQVPSVATTSEPKAVGSSTTVYVAGEGGQAKGLTARYKLMEADDVIASHDPRSFSQRKDYPEGVQERAYHRDKSEQAKVMRNAQKLSPEFVINTNPDAVNGPPIMGKDGVVLGGNSRTMSMQLAYARHPEKATQLREYLNSHAHEAGFSTEDVKQFKNPILVRVIDEGGQTKEDKQLLVRQMNESFTQSMDPRTMQVAMGRKLTDQAVEALGDTMQADETLNAFLVTNRAKPFIDELRNVGLIDQRNANQYFDKKGKMNADGKTLVARVLVGRAIGDADLLSATKPSIIENMARVVPYMAQAQKNGKGYDLSKDLNVALDAYNSLQYRVDSGTMPALKADMPATMFDKLFSQQEMFGEAHPVTQQPRAMGLLEVLIRRPGSTQITKVFKDYADQAAQNPEGQAGMFAAPKTPTEIFNEVVQRQLKTKEAKPPGGKESDETAASLFKSVERSLVLRQPSFALDNLRKAGPFIGPRGGKWADSAHTIPWKEEKKKPKRTQKRGTHPGQLTLDWSGEKIPVKKEKPKKEKPKKEKPKKEKPKPEGFDLWGTKINKNTINKIRQDMRLMTKAYKSIEIPVWGDEGIDPAQFAKDFDKHRRYFGTFVNTLNDWAVNRLLHPKDESITATEIRTAFWDVKLATEGMFPLRYSHVEDDYVPGEWDMKSKGPKALQRLQRAVRNALQITERYIEDKAGEIELPRETYTFNQGKVNYVVHSRSNQGWIEERVTKALSTVRKVQNELESLGLGKVLDGLEVHIHNEGAETVGLTTGERSGPGAFVAGWYVAVKDRLRLFPLGLDVKDHKHGTLVHELGHRMYWKQLDPKAVNQWEKVINSNRIRLSPRLLDQFFSKFIEGNDDDFIDSDKIRNKVKADQTEFKPLWEHLATELPYKGNNMTIKAVKDFYKRFPDLFTQGHISKEFVTNYANTNPSEMFAEVFKLYVTKGPGAVPPWTRQQFREVLRSGGIKLTKSLEDEDDLEKAGGPFYGPRGGKWADAKHTIPWKEEKKKPVRKQMSFDFSAEKPKPKEKESSGPYAYGMRYRPPQIGAVPNYEYKVKEHKDFRHGVIIYNKPLTKEEIKSYELTPLLDKKEIDARINKVVSKLNEYRDDYLEDLEDDPKFAEQTIRQAWSELGPGHVDDLDKVVSDVINKFKGPVGKKAIDIIVHEKVGAGGRDPLKYFITDEREDKVKLSRFKDSEYGPWVPKESLKHLKNDLEGKVDLPKSGRSDIDAVITGKAQFLGKGDDGLAFKVGDKIVKVSTTVPYQPDNAGHLTPKQAIERLKKQVEVSNELSDIKGIQRSEFVVHGDKGFQIKDWVEIPKKFTREQLDEIQKTVAEVHKRGYAIKDDIQAGLDTQGNPVLFDVGKAGKQSNNTGVYSDEYGDIDNLKRLYRDSGEAFVKLGVSDAMRHWQEFEGSIDSFVHGPGGSGDYARHRLKRIVTMREKEIRAQHKGKDLEKELRHLRFETKSLELEIKHSEKHATKSLVKAGPFIGPKGGKWADPQFTIPWKEGAGPRTKKQEDVPKPKRTPVGEPAKKQRQGKDEAPKPKKAAPGSQLGEETLKKLVDLKCSKLPQADIPADKIKVDFSGDVNSHALVVWPDSKGAIQSGYTPAFHEKNAKEKWDRITKFREKVPEVVKTFEDKLNTAEHGSMEHQAALVGSIIAHTGLRPGSEKSAKKHEHYGVVTLRPEHVEVNGDSVNFDFIGKSGKRNTATIQNATIAKSMEKYLKGKKEGESIFQSDRVVKTAGKAMPKGMKLKDMRTIKATQTAAKLLDAIPIPPPLTGNKSKDKLLLARAIKEVSERVAEVLNNTPAIARESYIHPEVIMYWALNKAHADRSLLEEV